MYNWVRGIDLALEAELKCLGKPGWSLELVKVYLGRR